MGDRANSRGSFDRGAGQRDCGESDRCESRGSSGAIQHGKQVDVFSKFESVAQSAEEDCLRDLRDG